jgi:hypothetical protein
MGSCHDPSIPAKRTGRKRRAACRKRRGTPVGMTVWARPQTARQFGWDEDLLDGRYESKRDSCLRDPTRHKTARKRKSGRSARNDGWWNKLWIEMTERLEV